ncbi:hypothetical protein D9758_002646 [Tetrapyrgos nigripes]|uniref:RRM domain-containing protein n=1 Tax=Tetrapyrgos nigripes TaxID=182062 RepID=A0A8H5GR91_9AGAR|nr:hypothetical protein D9758_002646 [Tetrapyrgos nigripes]
MEARIVRPVIAAAIPTTSVFCRTFLQSHVRQDDKIRRVVYFSNIPYATDPEELKDFAERFGTLEEISIPNDRNGRPAGFANVTFVNPEDAIACLNYGKTDSAMIGGRRSILHLLEQPRDEALPKYGVLNPLGKMSPPSRTLFLSNLPYDITAKDIDDVFQPFGKIERLNLRMFPFNLRQELLKRDVPICAAQHENGRSRGWGHLVFSAMENAQRVIDAHREDPFMFYNRAIIMDFARDGRKPSDQLYFSGFLGGVDQMKNTLESCRPRFVKLLRDSNTGEPTGTGFLSYNSVEEATAALKYINEELEFTVEYAKGSRGRGMEEGMGASKGTYGALPPVWSSVDASRHRRRLKELDLEADLKEGLAKVMQENVDMDAVKAMQQVTAKMLAENPFIPPLGCPVNEIPPELLAHIFYVGTVMEEEGSDEDEEEEGIALDEWEDDDSDEEEMTVSSSTNTKGTGKEKYSDEKAVMDEEDEESERTLPFQVLVSHVCRHWRDVAVNSTSLWTTIEFSAGVHPDRPKVWMERSKGHPLDIVIDCTAAEDEDLEDALFEVNSITYEVSTMAHSSTSEGAEGAKPEVECFTKEEVAEILDLIVPNVDRWRTLEVTANLYETIYTILERLSQCPEAPLLEMLQMYHYEDCEEYDTFSPPHLSKDFVLFNGNAPRLKDVAMWGVHLDWDGSLSYLNGLRDLELAYHAHDVRPSFETFVSMIHSSPELHTLSLCLSGPTGKQEDWGSSQIEIPSLKELVLCHHEPKYIQSLLPYLVVPNVVNLALDFDSEDYTDFAKMLATPLKGRTKSILAGLEMVKIAGLPSNKKAREMMLEQLANIHSINLNCNGDEEEFFDKLMETSTSGSGQMVVYCPRLVNIATNGIDGKQMKKFVEVRKAAGAPIARVSMSEDDVVDEREEAWLRDHLEELEFFEPSDEEEIEVDVSDIDEEDEDMDTDNA